MNRRPDRWFPVEQQERLIGLVARWRLARDRRQSLSPEEQAELEALVNAEIDGARQRAEALLREGRRGVSDLPNYPALTPVPTPVAERAGDWAILAAKIVFGCLLLGALALVNFCLAGCLALRR
jgi:hypothetical protein